MKKILLLMTLVVLFLESKTIAQTPYEGIPQFIPEDINTFNGTTTPWVRLHHGTFTNPEETPGMSTGTNVTHTIISTSSSDTNACLSTTGVYLQTIPSPNMIPDWDVDKDGPLRVMRLGDDVSRSTTANSSRITYYFKPNDEKNVLIVYFSFVAQHPGHPYKENPLFHIEVLQANGQPIATSDPKHAYFLVNPQGSSESPNPDAQNVRFLSCPLPTTYGDTIEWSNWIPVAFDLRPYIGQEIQLRITTRDCHWDAHYAYGYFAARGVKGTVNATARSEDQIELSVPSGCSNYEWYEGNTLLDSASSYKLNLNRNNCEAYYKCVATSITGAVLTFEITDPASTPIKETKKHLR